MSSRVNPNYAYTIRSYLTILLGIMILIVAIAVGHQYYINKQVRDIEHITNNYHLATMLHATRVIEDLHQLHVDPDVDHNEAADQATASKLINDNQRFALDLELNSYTVTRHITLITELQEQFADQNCAFLLDQLAQRHANFQSTSQLQPVDSRSTNTAGIKQMAKNLSLAADRLRRLHRGYYNDLTISLESLRHKNTIQLLCLISLLTLAGGLIIYIILRQINRIVRDQTETEQQLRDAQSRAMAASQSKSEFLANMSHEIRTPMTAILGYTNILIEEGILDNAPPIGMNAIQTIQRNCDYLLEIINDILDMSKVEAGKLMVEKVRCSPHQLIADVVSLMRNRAESKDLILHTQTAGSLPTIIQTDPIRVRQILINLIGNAIKFSERGAITVTATMINAPSHDNPQIQFQVTDTGIGMEPGKLGEIFEPFQQINNSITRNFGGTGLGLAISQRLTQLLGGNISVSSEPGKGSTFIVTIATGPLDGTAMTEQPIEVIAEDHRQPNTGSTQIKSAALEDTRILLAEDEPDNQRLISFVLRKAGATVEVAENGRIACEKTSKAKEDGQPFDVILMDMQMPEMDGYTATKKLRRQGHTLPIIALTAHAMTNDRDKCIDAGCDDYTTKPIKQHQLITLINGHTHRDMAA